MKHAATATLTICAVFAAGAKAPPPVLAHDGPWDVHTSENACLLGRKFGAGEQATLVAFQPLFNSETGELFVMTRDSGGGQRSGEAKVTQEPSGTTQTVSYFSNRLPGEKKRVTRLTIPRSVWEGLAETDVLSIAAPPVSVRVRLVRFGAAKPIFDRCERDILKEWDVDPVVLDPGHAPTPRRTPASFFSPGDYPAVAIQGGHVGRVVAIVDVDEKGATTSCRTGSKSWPDLNDATCKGAMRVRFSPAHDTTGRPIRSIFILPVRWIMPDGYP